MMGTAEVVVVPQERKVFIEDLAPEQAEQLSLVRHTSPFFFLSLTSSHSCVFVND